MKLNRPPHKFVSGQTLKVVCYDASPTYLDVERPTFVVLTGTVNKVEGITFNFLGGLRSVIEHFDTRVVLADSPDEKAQIEQIAELMALEEAERLEAQSDPSLWQKGYMTEQKSALYKKTAAQYRAKDYTINNE
jgi:hypothetical protein